MIAPDYYEEIGTITADQMRAITGRRTAKKVYPALINPDTGCPYKRRCSRRAPSKTRTAKLRRMQKASRRRNRQRA